MATHGAASAEGMAGGESSSEDEADPHGWHGGNGGAPGSQKLQRHTEPGECALSTQNGHTLPHTHAPADPSILHCSRTRLAVV
mgnify:CR=1 FL=1